MTHSIPLLALAVLVILLTVKGFGLIRLEWDNIVMLRELKARRAASQQPEEQAALAAVIRQCESLQARWLIQESDFDILPNTHGLVAGIALAYHPKSASPVEEARIGNVLQAALELKNHLLALAKGKEIRKLTQFRLRHLLLASRAWKLRNAWKEWRFVKLLLKYKLFWLFRRILSVLRLMDLTFWSLRAFSYILQDLVLKVFLVRWYLITGKLAMQVYRDTREEPKIPTEELIKDFESISEPEAATGIRLSREVERVSKNSKDRIMLHMGNLQWDKVKTVYADLVRDIARAHHPRADNPLYEATLFNLLMSGARFFDKIAAIETYPYLRNILNLKISHILLINSTVDFLQNSMVLDWLKKYKLGFALKYILILYKAVKVRNPVVLLGDLALSLVSEGCKRWFCLYLHDEICVEANLVYEETRPVKAEEGSPTPADSFLP